MRAAARHTLVTNCESDPPEPRTGAQCLMGQFTDTALRVLLLVIGLAILVVVARYVVFPGAQCAAGTSLAAGCAAIGPDF